MTRARVLIWAMGLLGLLAGWPAQPLVGQEMALAARRPRFLFRPAVGAAPIEIDANQSAELRRVVALRVEQPTIGRLLTAIERQTGLRFAYDADFPAGRPITLRADSITVAAALSGILLDTGVDVVLSRRGEVALVRVGQQGTPPLGSIAGRVTDAKTRASLAGATVFVEGHPQSATTGNDGRFKIPEIPPGTYTVRARYIGYAPGKASVVVMAEQEATADFALEKSAQRLDEVVTTGTLIPTELKALPTPVSVISDSDIALQRPHTMQEVLRQAVPTMVSWDMAEEPEQTALSARGASTIGGGGGGQMKVFVDGIPVADFTTAGFDPTSIARIEVIRGPQAAAIYGSDAAGGVVQVFTKRGDSTLARPQLAGEAAAGIIQTPYDGYGSVVRQSYRGSVRGGGSGMSYQFGAGYTHTPDWVQPVSGQSSPSVYGGMRMSRGILTADVTGRYFVENLGQTFNPALAQTGFPTWVKPSYEPTQYRHETLAAQLTVTPVRWWRNLITAGIDRLSVDIAQSQPRLTTPADTFLVAFNDIETRTTIGYNTTIQGGLGPAVNGSVTAGFDHYSLPTSYWFANALSTTGTIVTDPSQPISAARNVTNNTGYFAQAQLAWRDAIFLTGGVRAEQNTNFGDSLGTPVSPQFGLTYVRDLGATSVKLRGSWGRAIRAPTPGQKAFVPGSFGQVANPRLGPERQRGWDTGVDAIFGTRGSLSLTYFDQVAQDLISSVFVAFTPEVTSQNQNVGRVSNRGIELEGTLSMGRVQLRAQYGYVRSRIEDLGPAYSGDLAVGDQPLAVPTHTAGGALTFAALPGTTITGGLSYVGTWYAYDLLPLFRCFAGTGPCRPGPGLRNYIIPMPGFAKLNATVSQRITPQLSGFVSVDNLANNTNEEFSLNQAVMGRITTVGVQLHP